MDHSIRPQPYCGGVLCYRECDLHILHTSWTWGSLYRSLKHIEYLGLEPEEVLRWIDNLTAVSAADARDCH
jgi:hypothetical protein